ncbi:hypothetical protein MASR2M18_09120 [Ignavibacteria bacterium]|nr:response regulator [Bacteroidota bacterium]
MKILVVEDSPTARRFIKSSLISLGYTNIIEAEDGVVALKMLKSQAVDIVLTDWNMPNMNGIELINIIRNDEKFHNLPVIMITTLGGKEDVQKAIKSKVNGYVVKPFTPEALGRAIAPVTDLISKAQPKKEKNVVKIELHISGNTSEPIDEIQLIRLTTNADRESEFASGVISDVPRDFCLKMIVGVHNSYLHCNSEVVNLQTNTSESVKM